MERSRFLARIGRRLSLPDTPNLAHPMPEMPSPLPAAVYRDEGREPSAVLTSAAEDLGAQVRTAADKGALRTILDEVVHREEVSSVVLSTDPEVSLVSDLVGDLGVLEFGRGRKIAGAQLGITGTTGGIARTGTIVVESDRAGGRGASLVPSVHLALLRTDRIVDSPAAWWRTMTDRYPMGLPSQIVFISGPSKSADIEQTLTMGVHGPGSLWICLLEGDLLAP
jgi:L-lactate dehydrogenase complex protein LldG